MEKMEVSKPRLELSVFTFIADGMNVIYQIEQLPLMVAILIYGVVLDISYLVTYQLDDWLEWGATASCFAI